MKKKIRVGLLYGGKSGEHHVSLQTALAVMQAIDLSKYEVFPYYITQQGEWRAGPALAAPADSIEQLQFPALAGKTGEKAGSLISLLGNMASQPGNGSSGDRPLDVVFPLLHGTFGEDGTLQGLLEMAGLPYVGSGVLASAVGMDKVAMKKMFAQEGLPQCLFRHFTKSQWETNREYYLLEIETALGYPCFVKPANLGSSVGISKVSNRKELLSAVQLALRYDRKVIVEESVDAREIEIGVLGNDKPIVSVAGEVIPGNEFYDYKAKYSDGKTTLVIPAELPEDVLAQIREYAIAAFQAIDGAGLARVDFFVGREDGKVLINEINTMPGFTPFSMYPLLWRETGKPYAELLDDLIRLAFERHKERQSIQYTFDEA